MKLGESSKRYIMHLNIFISKQYTALGEGETYFAMAHKNIKGGAPPLMIYSTLYIRYLTITFLPSMMFTPRKAWKGAGHMGCKTIISLPISYNIVNLKRYLQESQPLHGILRHLQEKGHCSRLLPSSFPTKVDDSSIFS